MGIKRTAGAKIKRTNEAGPKEKGETKERRNRWKNEGTKK